MPRPSQRIESYGSVWLIDEDELVYLRLPKVEGPRPPGPNGEDWGGPGAGPLEDLHWLPFESWQVHGGSMRLFIHLGDGRNVSAPLGFREYDRLTKASVA
jgi:hypothetical protein